MTGALGREGKARPTRPTPGGDCKGMYYKGEVRGRYWVRAKVTPLPPPPPGGGDYKGMEV